MVEFGYSLDVGKSIDTDKDIKKKEETAPQDKNEVKPVSRHAPSASELAKGATSSTPIVRKQNDDVDVKVTSTKLPLKTSSKKRPPAPLLWATLLVIVFIAGASWITLTQSAYLPQLDEQARLVVEKSFEARALNDVRTQYPLLSPEGLNQRAHTRLAELLASPEYESEVRSLARQLKSRYARNDGQPYLYKADTYIYFRYARNLAETGSVVPDARDGRPFDMLRLAPSGQSAASNWWPRSIVAFHKGISALDSEFSLLKAAFYLPVLLGVIAALLFFLLLLRATRSLAVSGIAGALFAIHPLFFLGSFAGNADTQSPAMLFSVLVMLLSVCAITARSRRTAVAWSIAVVPALWLFSQFWEGWFYALALLLLFAAAWAGVALLNASLFLRKRWAWAALASLLGAFAIAAPYLLRSSWAARVRSALFKSSLNNIYPSLMSSISELQPVPLDVLVRFLGGWMTVLALSAALVWCAYRIVRYLRLEPVALFAVCWFVPLFAVTLLSRRFAFYLAAPAMLLFACGLVLIWRSIARLPRRLGLRMPFAFAQALMAAVVLAILVPGIAPYWAQTQYLPAMSDAHEDIGRYFQLSTPKDAIINAWWDEGYVWQAVARRATIWDNAAFDSPHAFWFPFAMTRTDPDLAKGILRMEDCSGMIGNPYDAFRDLPDGQQLMLTYLAKNRSSMEAWLRTQERYNNISEEKMGARLNLTHCAPRDAYVVITEDSFAELPQMVSLAQWNLHDGEMRKVTIGKSEAQAIQALVADFGLSPQEAQSKYYELRGLALPAADILVSDVRSCSKTNLASVISCGSNFLINLSSMDARQNNLHPHSLVVVENGVRRKRVYANAKGDFGMLLMRDDNGMYWSALLDASLMDTALVRLFSGERFGAFEPVKVALRPQRITVHRILWNGLVAPNATRTEPQQDSSLDAMVPPLANDTVRDGTPPENETAQENVTDLHDLLIRGII